MVSPKNTKKYLYALVGIVVILNIAGLINVTSNNNQINSMNNTIEKIYNEIYPADSSTNIQASIANKLLEFVISCLLEAIISKRMCDIDWRDLKNSDHWKQGWK